MQSDGTSPARSVQSSTGLSGAMWRRRLWSAVLTLPWWVGVLLIWGASRLITTAFMMIAASRQTSNPWTTADPGYRAFANIWDARWYNAIAFGGYPEQLPTDSDGYVAQNAWAFMPVYPMVVRSVMWVTGWSWESTTIVVSIVASTAAVLVLYRLLALRLERSQALVGVAFFSVLPVTPILQVGYAEGLHALLLVSALILVARERYLLALPLSIVASFTRPTGLAFAFFLGLLWLWRMRKGERSRFTVTQRVTLAVSAVITALSGLAWPAIAWAVTGSLTAYTDTELAWRSGYIGHQHLVPFSPWFQGAEWWMQRWTGLQYTSLVIVPAIVLIVAWALTRRPSRVLGPVIVTWVIAYSVYLLAVFFPQSSTFRLLLPLFPIIGALAVPRSWVFRTIIITVSLLLQVWWIAECWVVSNSDWTPP